MGRSISEDEAIEAAWNVQLPTLRLDMPLSSNNGFKQLQAERGDKAYADMGVWLQLCAQPDFVLPEPRQRLFDAGPGDFVYHRCI